MIPIPYLDHSRGHGGQPIAPGTPIPLMELCLMNDPDYHHGFTTHVEKMGEVSRLKKGIDPLRGNWTDDDFEKSIELIDYVHNVDTLAEAHGIWFDCPLCWAKNGGSIGTHGVLVWFVGKPVPPRLGLNSAGQPVRWNVVSGTGLTDLVLSPSIALQGSGCGWHGFVGMSGIPPGHAG